MEDDKKQEILKEIDDTTAPGKMTGEQALEFLQELESNIQSRIDGLMDDIKNGDVT